MGNVVLIENSSSKIVVATTNNPIIVTSGTIVNINVPVSGGQQLTSIFTASSAISSYQVVAAFSSTIVPASAANLNHVRNVIGVSISGAGVGSGVDVVTNGLVTNPFKYVFSSFPDFAMNLPAPLTFSNFSSLVSLFLFFVFF